MDIYRGRGVSKVGSVEQILPQQRLKTSNVSYISMICGKNGEGGKVYTKVKHSLSSIFRMINSLFSLRFLRYVDFFLEYFGQI